MSNLIIRKAERTKAKLRLAIAGPSGSGKTMGSLKLAKGLGGKVVLIDTERGSGDLYADLMEYDVITLVPPFKPDVLIEALNMCEAAGYDVIIVDSLSHFWADEGGLLDQADKMESAGKNRFTLWAEITPQHRRLVNALLNSPKHIIATMRSKQSYEMEKDAKTGKNTVKKLGLAPVQREGMEYEFTVFFDVDSMHNSRASKDRTNMFGNEIFMMDQAVGKRLLTWLNQGTVDIRGVKRDVIFQMKERLEISMPNEAHEIATFVKIAIVNLTGVEWKEENLEIILEKLVAITDKAWAQKVAWEPLKQTEPEAVPVPDAKAKAKTTFKAAAKKHAAAKVEPVEVVEEIEDVVEDLSADEMADSI